MDDYRETIWGIRPKDRGWFQLFTLAGGTAGSIILTLLELDSLPGAASTSEAARNIIVGIGASFVASGFIAWGLMQIKEIPMLIADWLRGVNERRRERWVELGRQLGREEGREEALREIYGPGYSDSQEGNRPQPPDADNANDADGDNANSRPGQ